MAEWFEDDSFWKSFGPYMFAEERMTAAVGQVTEMIALLGSPPGASILDLPCGVGRHSLEFARRGHAVTGVDLTQQYLDQAREHALAERLKVEWIQSDMRDFVRPSSFDGAINFFTSFGYFENQDDDLRVARNLCESLKKGARLLTDVNGKEVIARKFRPVDVRRHPDGALLIEERRVVGAWEKIESTWTLIRGNERKEGRLTVRLYSGIELAEILRRAGFRRVALYGSLAQTPYDEKAERLVAVAEK